MDERERGDDAVGGWQHRMLRGYGAACGEKEVRVVRLEGR